MANKSNIRSIRFSEEMAELIDQQQGDNFTQKFENLITRCVWELPARTSELKQLEERIEEKRQQLRKMTVQVGELHMTLNDLTQKAAGLEAGIRRALEKWDT